MIDYESTLAETSYGAATDEDLGRVGALAERQLSLIREIDELEGQLKAAKASLRTVQEEELPTLMDELGLSEIRTVSGRLIKVTNDYYAKIPEQFTVEAIRWLDEHGYGDIVKTELVTNFNRGELAKAREIADSLNHNGYVSTAKETVHFQTLKKWVKDMVELGTSFPKDLFGVHVGRKTVIK